MAPHSSFVYADAVRFPSFHSPSFPYLPSIIPLFRGSNYLEYFISTMIMIIFIIGIHAVCAKGQVYSRACAEVEDTRLLLLQQLLFSLQMKLPAFFHRGGEFGGVKPIQGDTFSGHLNILWSECIELYQISRPSSLTQINIKNLRMGVRGG